VGDAIDFWRVSSVRKHARLTLRAEMKLPGLAWLQFDADPIPGTDTVRLRQTALFDPRGLRGLLYWVALLPVHAVIFRGMLDRIRRAGERRAHTPRSASSPAPGPAAA